MALKKQMWAEAQVDKRRMREDFVLKIQYPSVDDLVSTNYKENLGDPQKDLNERLQESAAYAAEKSRAQLKSFIGYKAEEMHVYKSLPLGHDRRRNRYWQCELLLRKMIPVLAEFLLSCRMVDGSFNDILASLDVRGFRKAQLHSMLQRVEAHFKESVNKTRVDVKMSGQWVRAAQAVVNPLQIPASQNSHPHL